MINFDMHGKVEQMKKIVAQAVHRGRAGAAPTLADRVLDRAQTWEEKEELAHGREKTSSPTVALNPEAISAPH
jgi:hypothetical protein